MFSLSTTCSALVLMILEELEYLCIFSLLLSTSVWEEPKGSEVIRRRQEESVEASSLVPIETCIRSIFCHQMAGRESWLTVPESLAPGRGICMCSLIFIFLCSTLCAVSRAKLATWGTHPGCFLLAADLGEVGTLF